MKTIKKCENTDDIQNIDVNEKQKQELIDFIQSISNPKLIKYLYDLVTEFIRIRS